MIEVNNEEVVVAKMRNSSHARYLWVLRSYLSDRQSYEDKVSDRGRRMIVTRKDSVGRRHIDRDHITRVRLTPVNDNHCMPILDGEVQAWKELPVFQVVADHYLTLDNLKTWDQTSGERQELAAEGDTDTNRPAQAGTSVGQEAAGEANEGACLHQQNEYSLAGCMRHDLSQVAGRCG